MKERLIKTPGVLYWIHNLEELILFVGGDMTLAVLPRRFAVFDYELIFEPKRMRFSEAVILSSLDSDSENRHDV